MLIIDSDEEIVNIFKLLILNSVEAVTFSTQKNLDKIHHPRQPDLILVDEFLFHSATGDQSAILRTYPDRTKKVLTSTAYITQEDVGIYGADDVIYKPFDIDEFEGKISEWLLKQV